MSLIVSLAVVAEIRAVAEDDASLVIGVFRWWVVDSSKSVVAKDASCLVVLMSSPCVVLSVESVVVVVCTVRTVVSVVAKVGLLCGSRITWIVLTMMGSPVESVLEKVVVTLAVVLSVGKLFHCWLAFIVLVVVYIGKVGISLSMMITVAALVLEGVV